jgi:hypothetical protein
MCQTFNSGTSCNRAQHRGRLHDCRNMTSPPCRMICPEGQEQCLHVINGQSTRINNEVLSDDRMIVVLDAFWRKKGLHYLLPWL